MLDTSGVSASRPARRDDIGLDGIDRAALGRARHDDRRTLTRSRRRPAGRRRRQARREALGSARRPTTRRRTTSTFTFGSTTSAANLDVDFSGDEQDCDAPAGAPVEASGHACALLSVEAVGRRRLRGPDQDRVQPRRRPDLRRTLPADAQALINGEPLDWTLLLQVAAADPDEAREELDGAAQDVNIPLVGDALDAGANVVGAFNDNVVTPFDDLVAAAHERGATRTATTTSTRATSRSSRAVHPRRASGRQAPTCCRARPDPRHERRRRRHDRRRRRHAALRLARAVRRRRGRSPQLIRDFRVTFKLGQAIDGDVPFDIGLVAPAAS